MRNEQKNNDATFRWIIGILVAIIMSGAAFSYGQRTAIDKIDQVAKLAQDNARRHDQGDITDQYIIKTVDEIKQDVKAILQMRSSSTIKNNGG